MSRVFVGSISDTDARSALAQCVVEYLEARLGDEPEVLAIASRDATFGIVNTSLSEAFSWSRYGQVTSWAGAVAQRARLNVHDFGFIAMAATAPAGAPLRS